MAYLDSVADAEAMSSDQLVLMAKARDWSDTDYQAIDAAIQAVAENSDSVAEFASGAVEVLSMSPFSSYDGADKLVFFYASLSDDVTPGFVSEVGTALFDTAQDASDMVLGAGEATAGLAKGVGSFIGSKPGQIAIVGGLGYFAYKKFLG